MTYKPLLRGTKNYISRNMYNPLKEVLEGNNQVAFDTNVLIDFTLYGLFEKPNEYLDDFEQFQESAKKGFTYDLEKIYQSNSDFITKLVKLMNNNFQSIVLPKGVLAEFTGNGNKNSNIGDFLIDFNTNVVNFSKELFGKKNANKKEIHFCEEYCANISRYYNEVKKLNKSKETDLYGLIYGYVNEIDENIRFTEKNKFGGTLADKSGVASILTLALEKECSESILFTSDKKLTNLLNLSTTYLKHRLKTPTQGLIKYNGQDKGTIVKSMTFKDVNLESTYCSNEQDKKEEERMLKAFNMMGSYFKERIDNLKKNIKSYLETQKIELRNRKKEEREAKKQDKIRLKEEKENKKLLEEKMENKNYEMEMSSLDRMYKNIEKTKLEEQKPEELRRNYEDLNAIITFSGMIGYTNLKENAEFQALLIRENVGGKLEEINQEISTLEGKIKDSAIKLADGHDHSMLKEISQYTEEMELFDIERSRYDFISEGLSTISSQSSNAVEDRIYTKKELAEEYGVTPQSIANYVIAYPGNVGNDEKAKEFSPKEVRLMNFYFKGENFSSLTKELKSSAGTIKNILTEKLQENEDYMIFDTGKVQKIKIMPEAVEKLKEIMNK